MISSSRVSRIRENDAAHKAQTCTSGSERRIFGLSFSQNTHDELVEVITSGERQEPGPKIMATANLDHIVTLRGNSEFRAAYDTAWRVTADGMPVYLYARMMGLNLKERVTGSDLFAALMERWIPGQHRLFLLVSSERTGGKIREELTQRGFPADAVRIEVPPFGFEVDAAYSERLAREIGSFAPTHLIMGIGAPKSEIWAHRHRKYFGDMFILCVGASIEFVTGDKRRAPVVLRKTGLEWLWRFAMEPRRLFGRYVVRSTGFLSAIAADLSSKGARC